ncbi:formylglycine-generating enzyme family protein [Streptococcus pacificus]|uniref:Formylglycine-generating enzyme family protein n=1 Tax=Streptococcus pacificus TaxID=2740577 RepID=A0ABS0ZIW9_9STRE|nr:formylglycine-generating enzyme family protein [Streptococcus pacificus]MBJ8325889.1 formylglycine-generating enzyme family protein [Streptococcus pacificus]
MKEIKIVGGQFMMGDSYNEGVPIDHEFPPQLVKVQNFIIHDTPVTNESFSKFIEETDYKTDAEKYGWSSVFYQLIPEEKRFSYPSMPESPWWLAVEGARWNQPEGIGSSIYDRLDHPVVHVSRNDALAYCAWAKMRLPTEAEWEFAARAGTVGRFPWGEELEKDGEFMANTWQGQFPMVNTQEDGFVGTAPVYSFKPNQFGLYQMIGNVWEWCSNPYQASLTVFNEQTSEQIWNNHQKESDEFFAIRGGSFLCHFSYCNRYRVAARNGTSATSTSSNMGFRCVKSIDKN